MCLVGEPGRVRYRRHRLGSIRDRARGVPEPRLPQKVRARDAEPASQTAREIHRMYARGSRDVTHAEAGVPSVPYPRGRIAEPARRIPRWTSVPPSGHDREQIGDVVVIGRKVTLAGHSARDDPEERRRGNACMGPSPSVRARRVIDEVREPRALDGQLSHDRSLGPKVVGMHDAWILDDGAECARDLLLAADTLAELAAQHEADVQLLVGVRRVSRARGVAR